MLPAVTLTGTYYIYSGHIVFFLNLTIIKSLKDSTRSPKKRWTDGLFYFSKDLESVQSFNHVNERNKHPEHTCPLSVIESFILKITQTSHFTVFTRRWIVSKQKRLLCKT